MSLPLFAKKFVDGFKQGWDECQSDDITACIDDNNCSEEEQNLQVTLFPEYDEIYDIAHRSFYPEHPLNK